jgi:DNA-binding MarR family transcriptional regulator
MSMDVITYRQPLTALLMHVKRAALVRVFIGMAEAGFGDIREGHGCVFGHIDTEHGSRLTDLAESAGLTKQAVGEAASELERLGYVERVPDPEDGRAKIIRLTDRGHDAWRTSRRLFDEIERDWAEQLGGDLVATMREAAERVLELESSSQRVVP